VLERRVRRPGAHLRQGGQVRRVDQVVHLPLRRSELPGDGKVRVTSAV
jgi:hypothetical protein